MKISGLATPALVLDINTLKENMAAMSRVLEKSALKLRPITNLTNAQPLQNGKLQMALLV